MQSKIIMFSLVLFLQIRNIYGSLVNFNYNNKKDFFEDCRKKFERINDEKIFCDLEKHTLKNLREKTILLKNFFENNKFDREEIISFFNKKNLLFEKVKIIHKNLEKYKKKLKLKLIKNYKLLGIDKIVKFDDIKNNIDIIKEFYIKDKELTKNFISNPNNVNSKTNYKKYIDEIKLSEVNIALKNMSINMFSYYKLNDDIKEMYISSIINKIEILNKINNFKNNSDHKSKNINLNYKKLYYNDSVKNLSEIKFNIENIPMTINENIIEEFDKLSEIFSKLKNENLNMDLYENICKEFLNALDSFFLLFDNKTENKESSLNRDYGYLSFIEMFKIILLDSENNCESNINLISKIFFETSELTKNENNVIKNEWITKVYKKEEFGNLFFTIKKIDNLCLDNRKLFSEENETKFQEIFSERLTNVLENFNNLFSIINNYITMIDSDNKKNIENDILEKIVFFSFGYNNDVNIEENNLKKFYIKYFLDYLHYNYKINYNNLKKYEIMFLSTMFQDSVFLIKHFLRNENYLFDKLQKYEDMPNCLKNMLEFFDFYNSL